MEKSIAVEQEAGDLDGDVETIETGNPNEDQYIPGSTKIYPGGIKLKAKRLAYLTEKESTPYIARVNAVILEEDDSTTDEMLIQKTSKGARTIMGKGNGLEKIHIQSAKGFSIDCFVKRFKHLQSLGVASLVAQEFGHMLQYREVVGSSEEMKT